MILASLWESLLVKICCSLTVPGGQAGSEYCSAMIVKGKGVPMERSAGFEWM